MRARASRSMSSAMGVVASSRTSSRMFGRVGSAAGAGVTPTVSQTTSDSPTPMKAILRLRPVHMTPPWTRKPPFRQATISGHGDRSVGSAPRRDLHRGSELPGNSDACERDGAAVTPGRHGGDADPGAAGAAGVEPVAELREATGHQVDVGVAVEIAGLPVASAGQAGDRVHRLPTGGRRRRRRDHGAEEVEAGGTDEASTKSGIRSPHPGPPRTLIGPDGSSVPPRRTAVPRPKTLFATRGSELSSRAWGWAAPPDSESDRGGELTASSIPVTIALDAECGLKGSRYAFTRRRGCASTECVTTSV